MSSKPIVLAAVLAIAGLVTIIFSGFIQAAVVNQFGPPAGLSSFIKYVFIASDQALILVSREGKPYVTFSYIVIQMLVIALSAKFGLKMFNLKQALVAAGFSGLILFGIFGITGLFLPDVQETHSTTLHLFGAFFIWHFLIDFIFIMWKPVIGPLLGRKPGLAPVFTAIAAPFLQVLVLAFISSGFMIVVNVVGSRDYRYFLMFLSQLVNFPSRYGPSLIACYNFGCDFKELSVASPGEIILMSIIAPAGWLLFLIVGVIVVGLFMRNKTWLGLPYLMGAYFVQAVFLMFYRTMIPNPIIEILNARLTGSTLFEINSWPLLVMPLTGALIYLVARFAVLPIKNLAIKESSHAKTFVPMTDKKG